MAGFKEMTDDHYAGQPHALLAAINMAVDYRPLNVWDDHKGRLIRHTHYGRNLSARIRQIDSRDPVVDSVLMADTNVIESLNPLPAGRQGPSS